LGPDKEKMKIIALEKFIQNLSADLYSFAYVLIPDDLQATQLMIDSVSAFMIKNKLIIEKWKTKESFTDADNVNRSFEVKLNLFKVMYDLSQKRYSQLQLSFKDDVEDRTGFSILKLEDKAALYLKEKTEFTNKAIESILSIDKMELIAHLYSARSTMIENLPFKNNEGKTFA
jgi:hypothetical protein